jgi:hypothetical protein
MGKYYILIHSFIGILPAVIVSCWALLARSNMPSTVHGVPLTLLSHSLAIETLGFKIQIKPMFWAPFLTLICSGGILFSLWSLIHNESRTNSVVGSKRLAGVIEEFLRAGDNSGALTITSKTKNYSILLFEKEKKVKCLIVSDKTQLKEGILEAKFQSSVESDRGVYFTKYHSENEPFLRYEGTLDATPENVSIYVTSLLSEVFEANDSTIHQITFTPPMTER